MVDGTTDDQPKATVLGNIRNNPYTVENMIEAWNNIYPDNHVSTMNPTHLYVKFAPEDEEDLVILVETGETLYDFPLEYEVIEMGDYYEQPGKAEGDLPDLYAVVDPDFTLPAVPYTIEAELILPEYMSYLTGEAFRLTGNSHPLSDATPQSISGPCEAGCPDYPCCLDAASATPMCGDCIKDPCIPGSPNYPQCAMLSGPTTQANACGCQVSTDNRHPGGCINVEDTELGNVPVRKVKVIMKDTWFTENETYTNIGGCWNITDRRFHGTAWIWIKFQNGECKIRGTRPNWRSHWEWITPVTDYVGRLNGTPFNEIDILYTQGPNASQAHRYWSAATVNNAVHEFLDYAAQDNISGFGYQDIYINRNNNGGAALMTSHMPFLTYMNSVSSGLWNWLDNNLMQQSIVDVIVPLPVAVSYVLAPDIIIGTDFNNSDQLKRLAYHEYAHASHQNFVGAAYWGNLITAEITAEGHGDQNSTDAGLIAVVESWAEYIGMSYTHRTNDANHSLGAGTDWELDLEALRNERTNHIPIGLHYDLVDNSGNEARADDDDDPTFGPITDQVDGFSNAQMFQSLNANITTPDQYRQWLNNNFTIASGNTVIDVNNLFTSY